MLYVNTLSDLGKIPGNAIPIIVARTAPLGYLHTECIANVEPKKLKVLSVRSFLNQIYQLLPVTVVLREDLSASDWYTNDLVDVALLCNDDQMVQRLTVWLEASGITVKHFSIRS